MEKVMHIGKEEGDNDLSLMDHIVGMQDRLKKVLYKMKNHNKEVFLKLAFPEAIMLSPPPRIVQIKGAKKKRMRSKPK